jgi:chromosome segregation ATPase
MSLTDEIYRELWEGLEKGLDWRQFAAKYSASKGPLYNAIGRFFNEVKPKIEALNEKKSRVQSELDQARLTLDSLNQRIKEAESNIASLEERENVLNGQVETLEAKLAEKSELAKHLAELEKLGFDSERLNQLREALREIGAKHGIKGKETVSKFFDGLKDYDALLGAELQLKVLQTQIETKKLEAENWQAKEEALRRKHDDLKGALEAVHTLRIRSIKVSQIITWHQILSRFQTVEQFAESVTQYGDMTKLLNTKREEAESYELITTKSQSQVEALEKERAKIEGAIGALKVAGVKELRGMTEKAKRQLESLADIELNETREVGQAIRAELTDYLARLDTSNQKAFEIGQECEKIRLELQKYVSVRDVLESHAAGPEAENEFPEQS